MQYHLSKKKQQNKKARILNRTFFMANYQLFE